MKKTISLVIISSLFGSAVALAGAKLFSDVNSSIWYANAVASLSEKGIINGYTDGTFRPDNNVNRAELAVMMDRLLQYVETGEVANDKVADNTTNSSCSAITSTNLVDMYSKITTNITNTDQNIKNAISSAKPKWTGFDENFFIKGITAKLSDTLYASVVEVAKNTDTLEYLITSVVQTSASNDLSYTSRVFKDNNNSRNVEYIVENCAEQVNGTCHDHAGFPLQNIVKIDDANKSASLETITPSNDPNTQNATVVTDNVNYSEADSLYNCVKADIKVVSDAHGKTPSQW